MNRSKASTLGRPWLGFTAVAAAAALPILRILANNPDENLSVPRLVVWGLGSLIVGWMVLWVARRVDARGGTGRLQASVVAALLVVLMYGSVLGNALKLDEPWIRLSVVVAMVLGAWLAARWGGIQRFFIVLPFFLLVAPAFDLVKDANARGEVASGPTASVEFPPPRLDAGPNVYWFVLDGYGRWDVLQALGGDYDLGVELANLGFQVDDKAVAPYDYTDLSLAATLTGSYLPELSSFGELRSHAQPIVDGQPPVFDWFEHAGYRRLLLPGARWPGWRCGPPHSTCLMGSRVHLEDDLIFSMTILDPLLDLLTFGSGDRHAKAVDPVLAVESAFAIQEQDTLEGRPHLSVIHVMSSHPPYRWLGPDCAPQPSSILMSNWLPLTDYLDAVRCTGVRTLEAVERIVVDDPDALVIVQSDHGPRLQAETWQTVDSEISTDTVWLGVLLAAKLPDGCELGHGTNTVNLFRIVLGCLGGDRMDLLPSRSWVMGGDWDGAGVVPASPDRGEG